MPHSLPLSRSIRSAVTLPVVAVLLLVLASCGASTPRLQDVVESRPTPEIYDSIVRKVDCEIQSAVQMAILQDRRYAEEAVGHDVPQGRRVPELDKWVADVTLTLTVDEKSGFSPGISLNAPIQSEATQFANKTALTTPQAFTFGLGANLSSQATRRDTIEWLVNFAEFSDERSLALAQAGREAALDSRGRLPEDAIPGCGQRGGRHIEGNLLVRDWIFGLLPPAYGTREEPGSPGTPYENDLERASKARKKDVFSHQVTFALVYGANATPAWKLFRLSANQGNTPFVMGQRTRTQDLQIVIGPALDGSSSPARARESVQPSERVTNAVLVGQIQQALQTALKNTQ